MSFMNELPRGRRPSISETFQFACDDAQIPGVVLAASSGKLTDSLTSRFRPAGENTRGAD